MKIVYIAGPYRGEHEYQVHANIMAARDAAIAVWRMGAVALCPHQNSMFMGGVADDDVFLTGDLILLERCDAVLLVGDWRSSQGAVAEAARAEELHIPTFVDLAALRRWLYPTHSRVSYDPRNKSAIVDDHRCVQCGSELSLTAERGVYDCEHCGKVNLSHEVVGS